MIAPVSITTSVYVSVIVILVIIILGLSVALILVAVRLYRKSIAMKQTFTPASPKPKPVKDPVNDEIDASKTAQTNTFEMQSDTAYDTVYI